MNPWRPTTLDAGLAIRALRGIARRSPHDPLVGRVVRRRARARLWRRRLRVLGGALGGATVLIVVFGLIAGAVYLLWWE